MKIDYKKINKKDLKNLLLDKNMNIAAADALFNFCFYSAKDPINKDRYLEEVKNYLELNLSIDEDRYFYESRIVPAIKPIKVMDYEDNYYHKNIKPVPYKTKGYELTYLMIKPYQALPYDDIGIDANFVEVSRIGYFEEEFKYLAVLKDDVVWMSTDPNEINTMRKDINDSHGRVLAFGLGLGYFPIMCAIKDDVKEVVILEKDQTIIDIFIKHILPLFEFKAKIKVVHDDAFNYVEKGLHKEFNYLFIDIWHNPEDGLPLYLRFKKMLKNYKGEVRYWLEKSILAMYRRCLLTIFEEDMMGYTKKNYLKSENEYDQIVNDLYFKTENMSFSSMEDVKEILQDKGLLKLIQ